jgi:hypothetical protein
MDLDKLERQVLLWNRAAILVPIFFTALLGVVYVLSLCDIKVLFFIACGLYFTTAIIWWWWTMKSIHLLVGILKKTNYGIKEVTDELRSIRNDITIDIKDDI